MATRLLVEHVFKTVYAGTGPQMIHCSYQLLRHWEHDDLSAPYWRWYWNDAPGAVIRSHGRKIALASDRVVLIPPNTPFASETRATVGHLHCHFVTGARLAARFSRPIVRYPSADELCSIQQLANQMRDDGERNEWATIFRTHALTAAAIADIPADQWETDKIDSDIARVLAMMHERPSEPLDNRALGQLASMSTNTLLRRFRRATGTTPHRYLARLRTENAAIDLLATDDSIDAIAARHGFCDRFHLSRTFTQMLSISPAAYRAGHRN